MGEGHIMTEHVSINCSNGDLSDLSGVGHLLVRRGLYLLPELVDILLDESVLILLRPGLADIFDEFLSLLVEV